MGFVNVTLRHGKDRALHATKGQAYCHLLAINPDTAKSKNYWGQSRVSRQASDHRHTQLMTNKRSLTARFIYYTILVTEKILSVLPTPFIWKFGALLGRAAYPLANKRRAIVLHNLQLVHPEYSEKQIATLSMEVFRYSFANLFCSLKTSSMSGKNISNIFSVKGLEQIQKIADGKGAVLMLFHMSNWEILTKVNAILPNKIATGCLYKPLKNPFLDEHIQNKRELGGTQLFSKRSGLVRANRLLRDGGLLGILCDQSSGGAGIHTELFGKKTSITPLPAILALKHQCPIIPVTLETISPGRWEIRFLNPVNLPLGLDKAEATKRLVKTMEIIMHTHSRDTFWLHDLWKTKPRKRRKKNVSHR